MKLLMIQLLFTSSVFGSTLRSVDSSAEDYLLNTKETFVQFQLNQIKSGRPNTEGLDEALHSIYENQREAVNSILNAIHNLQLSPLNVESKNILSLLLQRGIERTEDSGLRKSLLHRLQSLCNLDRSLLEAIDNDDIKKEIVKKDEGKNFGVLSFIQVLQNREDFKDSQLLVDGSPQKINSSWQAPQGVYQWTLLSNVYEPSIFVGNWNDFSADLLSKRDTKLLIEGSCEKFHLSSVATQDKDAEIFFSKKCIQTSVDAKNSFSLGDNRWPAKDESTLPRLPKLDKPPGNDWIVPALLVVGAGLYLGLKDKQVTFKAPSFKF